MTDAPENSKPVPEQPKTVVEAAEKVETMLQSAQVAASAQKSPGFFKRAWRGEEKLWKIFWIYGVLIGIVFGVLQILLAIPLLLLSALIPFAALLPMAIMVPYSIWNTVSLWRCAWNAKVKFWGYIVRVLVVLIVIAWIYSIVTMIMSPPAPDTDLSTKSNESSAIPMSSSEGQSVPPVVDPAAPVPAPLDPISAAPASEAPIPAPVATPPAAPAAPGMDECEKRMVDFATQNKADATAYIAQNQAYLAQCRQALAAQPKP